MPVIIEKITEILEKKKLTRNKLALLIGYDAGSLNKMIKGEANFPPYLIKKLLPILKVTKDAFESWIVADKYSKEVIEQAIEEKKAFPYKRKSILTTKIDKMLEEKNMSRTALSKQINYSQSALNAVIIGQKPMSETLITKLSCFFELSESKIISWIVADKYSLKTLEFAVKLISQ